jgi:hypothetical protein
MNNLFDGLAPDDAVEIEGLSRLLYELRRNRDRVLNHWGAADAPALLARIEAGEVAEHPAYEHYLSARILDETRQAIRDMLAVRLRESGQP